jgi:hypothetical protein
MVEQPRITLLDGLEVTAWAPRPDAAPTQVHLVMKSGKSCIRLKMKAPKAVDELISALQEQKATVWREADNV